MRLTLFDLDHTLIDTDSNQAWVRFLIAHGVLPEAPWRAQSAAMERRYRDSPIGIDVGFCEFFIGTLTTLSAAKRRALLPRFVEEMIVPAVNPGTLDLIDEHRARGDELAIITATNRLITEPIASWFGIASLIATEAELVDDVPTGKVAGIPSMREGKVERLDAWLASGEIDGARVRADLDQLTFYSDSVNDLPLLERASHPVAVNPDAALLAHARARGWPVREL